MPIPIGLVSGHEDQPERSGLLDISFLANSHPIKEASIPHSLADNDANALMKIWLEAKKVGNDTFDLDKLDMSNKELIRLKTRGLVSGGTSRVTFTAKAKTVICTMTLGESNNFLKDKKEKSYTEILASMDKRGKAGFRTAEVYDENSHLLNLTASSDFDKQIIIKKIMESLVAHFGKGMVKNDNSFEMMDETMGTCWVEATYQRFKDVIVIDKYYEDEMLNDEMGKMFEVPYIDNYDALQMNVVQAIESMMI